MRTRLPRSEARETTIELYGRTWRTLQSMFDDLASDVSFDIDLVFSWVDGSSTDFQRERAKRMQGYVVGEGDDSDARFRQIDELKYALRSVYLFAPWVRRIFIATDSPAPDWLAEHPRVTIMRSEEFFADTSVLPTHNSHAVESQLHHIPGLAEHFLYSNDDMFFGRPVGPELFFSPGGVTKFVEAATRIGLGENDPSRSGFENAARVNRALLLDRFGKVTTRHLEHTAAPLREERDARAGGRVPRGLRAHRGQPVPLGHRHLGDQLAVPLLRADDRAGGGADAGALALRRDDPQAGAAADEPAAQAPRPGHVLPQRRQLSRDLRRGAHARRSPSSSNATSRSRPRGSRRRHPSTAPPT